MMRVVNYDLVLSGIFDWGDFVLAVGLYNALEDRYCSTPMSTTDKNSTPWRFTCMKLALTLMLFGGGGLLAHPHVGHHMKVLRMHKAKNHKMKIHKMRRGILADPVKHSEVLG